MITYKEYDKDLLKTLTKQYLLQKFKLLLCDASAQNLKIIHSMSKYYVVILVLPTRMLVL